jgi:hypothetical protein
MVCGMIQFCDRGYPGLRKTILRNVVDYANTSHHDNLTLYGHETACDPHIRLPSIPKGPMGFAAFRFCVCVVLAAAAFAVGDACDTASNLIQQAVPLK